MTFEKFNEIFKSKYPQGEAFHHGEMGGTEKNKKVAVVFQPNGKVYEYYGAYEDVLTKMGVKVISKSRVESYEETLKSYEEEHGKEDEFFGLGIMDYSKEIKEWSDKIAEIRREYIVI